MKKIVIVAGDKSGDLYGGNLSRLLNEKFGSPEIHSFGGDCLSRHSKQEINLLKTSVCGLVEVISSLGELINTFNQTLKRINEIKPNLIILIDFPDFNLRLAKKLNNRYPVFYYISPQVWAWRKNRINTIKKYVEKMIVIFGFEEEFYKKEGIGTLYFGHPLLELINQEPVEPKKVISFLPGSRINEVKKHLPLMQEAKNILAGQLPGYAFRIIKPANLKKEIYGRLGPGIEIVDHSYQAIKESEFIVASSGTATVEIAILGVPYIIIYKVNQLTFRILKRLVNAKFIGMINILAGREIVNELIQEKANPQNITEACLGYLKDKPKYARLKQNLKDAKELLKPQDSLTQFADYIGSYLNI